VISLFDYKVSSFEKLPKNNYCKMIKFIDTMSNSSPENFREELLYSLDKFFGYKRTCSFLIDDEYVFDPVFLNLKDYYIQSYCQYYYKKDVFNHKKVKNEFSGNYILTIDDILPLKQYETTEYYEFLREQDIYYVTTIFLTSGDELIGRIGLLRSIRENSFSEEELITLKMISSVTSKLLEYNLLLNKDLEKGNHNFDLLTKREKEILKLVIKGYTNQEIAGDLCISVYTVKMHIYNIFKKLHISHRTAIANKLDLLKQVDINM
jgi:DNA-binding CsgD family transcriptional regulator